MERTELLNNLYAVRDLIGRIMQEKSTLDEICDSYEDYQEELNTKGVLNKGKVILSCVMVAYALILFMRQQWFFLFCMGAYAYCRSKGKTSSKIYKILDFIFKFQAFWLVYDCITSPEIISSYITLFTAAGIICAVVIKSKNNKVKRVNVMIEEKNNNLYAQYAEHREICDEYQNELVTMTQDWFPQSYLSVDCIDFFISSIENWRADDFKELINLYEQKMHNQRMEELQKKVVQQNNRMLNQNEELLRQQRTTNVLQMFQIGQHAQTHMLLQQNANNLSSMQYNASRAAKALDNIKFELTKNQ